MARAAYPWDLIVILFLSNDGISFLVEGTGDSVTPGRRLTATILLHTPLPTGSGITECETISGGP